ncbi:hypothetical protein V6N11_012919 [Hibiscus sabdariffa]|uniref:Uncharacterized protein n=2 Tax=Hibiscus sabdariffa TaxID=183260 RepID=A0ABR2N9C5_9ROSI
MTLEDAGSGPNGLDASDGDANSGLNADDGPFNKIAGENNYETDGDNREDGLGAADTLREDSEGDSSTEYLESSDAGSYETDSEVAHRFEFKYVSNRKEKIRVVCKVKGCPFMLHASWDKSDGFYKINTLVDEHQCSVTFKNKRADFILVGKHFLSKLRIVPNLKLIEMIKLAREELSVEINKDCCQKAKKWALEQIRGSVVHEFNRLFDYMYVLRSADPNGNFELMVERPTVDEKPKFRRLYVCFSALKEAFKKYCRQVISLDGCFLKGSFQDEILSAVGRDSNDQIFPIAWAVVEVENRDTWTWFLNNIQMDLELENGEKVTLISDMQKVHEEATTYDFGPSIPAISISSQPVAPNQPIPIDPSIPATTSASSQPVAASSQPTLVTQLRRSAPKWKITTNRTLELVREVLDLE